MSSHACSSLSFHEVQWACIQFLSLSEQLTRISQCLFPWRGALIFNFKHIFWQIALKKYILPYFWSKSIKIPLHQYTSEKEVLRNMATPLEFIFLTLWHYDFALKVFEVRALFWKFRGNLPPSVKPQMLKTAFFPNKSFLIPTDYCLNLVSFQFKKLRQCTCRVRVS